MQVAMGRTAAPFSAMITDDIRQTTLPSTQARLRGRYVRAGMYHKQVKRYLDQFPRAQVLVEIIDRPGIGDSRLGDRLSAFLGAQISDITQAQRLNQARHSAYPRLNHFLFRTGIKNVLSRLLAAPVREKLKRGYFRAPAGETIDASDHGVLAEIHRDDCAALADLLGEDLSHWLVLRSPVTMTTLPSDRDRR